MDYYIDWNRISKCAGYPAVFCPDHPRSWSTGYIHIHILIAEQKLGRPLQSDEVVHHKNHDKSDYSEDNLIVTTDALHRKHHLTSRPVELICAWCNKGFKRQYNHRPEVMGNKNNYCSRNCYWSSLRK